MINIMEVTLDYIRNIRICQPKKGYRFSVDALLLYHFVSTPLVRRIADLGAGSGIIGLLLAEKYPRATVLLLELQDSLARAGERNISLNNMEGRVKVLKADVREIGATGSLSFEEGSFDIAVSNPPFRKERSGLVSTEVEKAIARHEIKLKLPELVRAASYLLKPKGRFFLIHHPGRLAELARALKEKALEIKRLRFVHSNVSSEAKMVLVEAARGGRAGLRVEKPLFIYGEDGRYTDEMRRLYEA